MRQFTVSRSYVVLIGTLQVNDCVKKLAKEGKDTIILVE
jgi:hypothetical protein